MPRQAAHIREATPDDADELLMLWAATHEGDASIRETQDAKRALANLAAHPDERLLVVECETHIVAAMQLSRGPVSPLSLDSVVHTSFLVVAPEQRRHGYAHALMEAAVSWAEEKDIAQITTFTDGNRDTNRFFARLGLTTLATVRSAPTSVLLKKLAADRGRATGKGNRHLVEVLAQRRSMRRRQNEG